MKCYTLKSGYIENNIYIAAGDDSKTAVVIDPNSAQSVINLLEQQGLDCELIILTHGHFDHVAGAQELVDRYGCDIAIGRGDAGMLEDENLNMSKTMPGKPFTLKAGRLLDDGDVIKAAGLELTVIGTPGHTPGGICLLCGRTLFTGDTLFRGCCGRVDFPGGDENALRESFKKLYALEGDYECLPGHEQKTRLDWERRSNLFMRSEA